MYVLLSVAGQVVLWFVLGRAVDGVVDVVVVVVVASHVVPAENGYKIR